MTLIIYLSIIGFLALFFLLRNKLIWRIRNKRIDWIFVNGMDYQEFNKQTYNQMFFDFRKWTYKDFYP